MNKESALKRLDAIETEAKELRKIIDGKIEYKKDRFYVGVMEGNGYGKGGYILVGSDTDDYFRFHYFGTGNVTELGRDNAVKTAQKCIDNFIAGGGTVHEFDDVREGFEFFLSKYQG